MDCRLILIGRRVVALEARIEPRFWDNEAKPADWLTWANRVLECNLQD
jgi:hypothetical protein